MAVRVGEVKIFKCRASQVRAHIRIIISYIEVRGDPTAEAGELEEGSSDW